MELNNMGSAGGSWGVSSVYEPPMVSRTEDEEQRAAYMDQAELNQQIRVNNDAVLKSLGKITVILPVIVFLVLVVPLALSSLFGKQGSSGGSEVVQTIPGVGQHPQPQNAGAGSGMGNGHHGNMMHSGHGRNLMLEEEGQQLELPTEAAVEDPEAVAPATAEENNAMEQSQESESSLTGKRGLFGFSLFSFNRVRQQPRMHRRTGRRRS